MDMAAKFRCEPTFRKLDAWMDGVHTRTIANNTVVERQAIYGSGEGEVAYCYAIRLHGHTIAVLYANGTCQLVSCGWRTVTTKARLDYIATVNGYGRVFARNYDWKVGWPSNPDSIRPFSERMVVGG